MSIKRALQIIAGMQHGYFTAQQAKNAGYKQYHHNYHVNCGNWQRIERGVFRLPGFEDSLESEFVKWTFWATGIATKRKVTVSHESALAYYGLAWEPCGDIHLTVSSRQFNKNDKNGCVLHRGELSRGEYIQQNGYRITTPQRTLLDMKPELVLRNRWAATVLKARHKELINHIIADDLLGENSYCHNMNARLTEGGGAAGEGSHPQDVNVQKVTNMIGTYQNTRFPAVFSGWRTPNRSFTLVELLVVISILCILMSLLLPTLSRTVGSAYNVSCRNQLYLLGSALSGYSSDFYGYVPTMTYCKPDTGNMDTNIYSPIFVKLLQWGGVEQKDKALMCPATGKEQTESSLIYASATPISGTVSSYGTADSILGFNMSWSMRSEQRIAHAVPKLQRFRSPNTAVALMDTLINIDNNGYKGYMGFAFIRWQDTTDWYTSRIPMLSTRHGMDCINTLSLDGHANFLDPLATGDIMMRKMLPRHVLPSADVVYSALRK